MPTLFSLERGSQEYAYGQSKTYVWELRATAGTGNESYSITRVSSGQGGSDKGDTEGRTLDPWATLPTVEYQNDSA